MTITFHSQLLILKNKEVKDKKREYEGCSLHSMILLIIIFPIHESSSCHFCACMMLQSFLHATMLQSFCKKQNTHKEIELHTPLFQIKIPDFLFWKVFSEPNFQNQASHSFVSNQNSKDILDI